MVSTFQSSSSKRVALGEQFERARVEPSVALVVDPVEPGLPGFDLIARGPEPDVGSELGRRADGGVKALAQPVRSTSAASSRSIERSRSSLAVVLNL